MNRSLSKILCTLCLATAIATPTLAANLELVLDESTAVAPTDVTLQQSADGLRVKGWVAKRQPRHGRIIGHVEIRVLDVSDRMLMRKDTYPVHFSPTRRNPRKASFSTLLEHVPAEAARIEVSYRVGDEPIGSEQP